jgi:hypothetical protein
MLSDDVVDAARENAYFLYWGTGTAVTVIDVKRGGSDRGSPSRPEPRIRRRRLGRRTWISSTHTIRSDFLFALPFTLSLEAPMSVVYRARDEERHHRYAAQIVESQGSGRPALSSAHSVPLTSRP